MIEIVPTTPFEDQRPGTSGLRKKTVAFRKPRYVENFIQSLVKAMRGRIHDLTPDDPQILLPLPLLPGSHCHAV